VVIPETVRRLAGLGKRVILKATSEGLLITSLDTEEFKNNDVEQ